MAVRFTDLYIRKLLPKAKRYERFDEGRRGFGIRVSTSGTKTWIFMCRRSGKMHRITLGTYPEITLATARIKHTDKYNLLAKGADLSLITQISKPQDKKDNSITTLCELYIERFAKLRKRSWKEDDRILKKDILPRWGTREFTTIKRADIISLLDAVVDRGASIQANRTLAVVRKMFNFAVNRGLLEISPCNGIAAPAHEKQRDRVLTEHEIHSFWHMLDNTQMSIPVRLALKLQLVTAQRKGEIVKATWDELDLSSGWWTIPESHSKNGKSHRIPLSSLAIDLLEVLLSSTPPSQFLFPSRQGDKAMRDTSIDHALRKNREIFQIEAFVPHDLRRTAASHMTALGIQRLVVSKILNHAETGVTAVYDRYAYDNEKINALDRWSEKLSTYINPTTAV